MSQDNVEVVREIYAQWARGNMSAGVEIFNTEFTPFREEALEAVGLSGATVTSIASCRRRWHANRRYAE